MRDKSLCSLPAIAHTSPVAPANCDSRAPRTLLASANSLPLTSDSRSEADTEPALHFPACRDFGRRLPLRSHLLNASIFSCQRPKLQQQPLGAPSSVDHSSYYIVKSYFIFIYMLSYDIEITEIHPKSGVRSFCDGAELKDELILRDFSLPLSRQ